MRLARSLRRGAGGNRPFTNYVAYSYDLTNWADKVAGTVAQDATDAAGRAGSTYSDDGTNDYHYVQQGTFAALSAAWYEIVVRTKSLVAGKKWLRVFLRNGAFSNYGGYYFDSALGAVGTAASANLTTAAPSCVVGANGECTIRFFILSAAETCYVQLMWCTADGSGEQWDGDGVEIAEVYQVQVCDGYYAHPEKRTNG